MDGIFGNRFDLNNDGYMSVPEHMIDFAVYNHFVEEVDAEVAAEEKARASKQSSKLFSETDSFVSGSSSNSVFDPTEVDFDDEDDFDEDDFDDEDDDLDEDDFDDEDNDFDHDEF